MQESLELLIKLAKATDTPAAAIVDQLVGLCWDEEIAGWLKENIDE